MEEKSVCVIGAGMSGLAATKIMIDAGFAVTCLEKDGYVGGRWHQKNSYPIPRTTITNLPKYHSCYSDFPMPDDFPLYLPADKFSQYFESFAENFNLYNHIKFYHEVVEAKLITLEDSEQIWKVICKDQDGTMISNDYDFLVVCSGLYTQVYIPEYLERELSNFTGNIIHSRNFVDSSEFKEKNVVISGFGNTGGDISVEVSKVSSKAILSTGKGAYILNRMIQNGKVPIDVGCLRISQYIPSFFANFVKSRFLRNCSNHCCDLAKLHLTPESLLSVIVNDEITLQIASGKVLVKPAIERIEDKTVFFSNNTKEENVDSIILCTGYTRTFSFLDEDVLPLKRNGKEIPLYKRIFSPEYQEKIAFIGLFVILGPVIGTMEMQARYAAEVFKGNATLPTKEKMEEEIDNFAAEYRSMDLKEYNLIPKPWQYQDELADEIGCRRPSLLYILLTDPLLFWYLCGSYNCHEYRLDGPNKWNGARDAIINKQESMYAFMKGSRDNP